MRGGKSMRPVRVLIADDHDLFAKTLGAVLAGHEGIEVVAVARDGREALQLAVAHAPDVVLMDLDMPNLDGFEATRRLRSLLPETPVLVLTASSSAEDSARAMQVGAAGYLTKDRIVSDLTAVVRALGARQEPAAERLLGRSTPDFA
jgi:DNA-binding NarL/FixJ family response regulator